MAEVPYGTSMDGGSAPAVSISTLTTVLGAAISIAVFIGLIVWSVQLILRDVSGIPVVQALDGPMRIAPEDPGGRAADHQGLSVNTVAATGVAEAPRPQARLAPTQTELAPEDQPAGTIVIAEPVEEVTQTEVVTAPQVTVAIGNRPRARPAALTTRPSTAEVAAPTQVAATGIDIDAATLAAGTRLAQVGAYETPAIATAEWDRLSGRFPTAFDAKQRVIQQAESGGRTFYRLRVAGFSDVSEVRNFCATLSDGRAACIPVLVR